MERIHTRLFDHWAAPLDTAWDLLPEHPHWPKTLYRRLIDAPTNASRRFVLWERHSEPVGLLALVREHASPVWQPVTQWIVPGFLGLGEPRLLESLCLGLNFATRFAWWRMPRLPQSGGNVRAVEAEPTFRLPCSTDFDQFWRKTGLLRDLRRASRRSRHLELRCNADGAARWIITGSERTWREACHPAAENLQRSLDAAEFLAGCQRLVAFTLQDHDQFVAGDISIIHGDSLVSTHTFRNREYNKMGAGNLVLEAVFRWGKSAGLREIDLGGGFDYKRRWALQDGTKARVLVSGYSQYLHYCANRRIMRPLRNAIRRFDARYRAGADESAPA